MLPVGISKDSLCARIAPLRVPLTRLKTENQSHDANDQTSCDNTDVDTKDSYVTKGLLCLVHHSSEGDKAIDFESRVMSAFHRAHC